MSNEHDMMRILGNIEGKLDGILTNQNDVRMRVDGIETNVNTLHTELREHKAKTLQDRDRVLGGLYVAGGFMSTVWLGITFFKDAIVMFLTGKGPG